MSYFDMFKTNIPELSQGYTKFMVSRVVSTPKDRLVEFQVPSTLPSEFTVEMSLYSLSDDYLVYNASFDSNEETAFYVRTLQYDNSELRKLLFVDLASIKNNFPSGEFRLVLNLYVNEFGTSADQILQTSVISPSRYEVELELTPEYDTAEYQSLLMEFALPRLTADATLVAIDQIFGKDTTETIQSDNSVFTFDSVKSLLPDGLTEEVVTELEDITTVIMDGAYDMVVSTIQSDISSGKTTFTNAYLKQVVDAAIAAKYEFYVTTQEQTESAAKVTLVTD